MITAVQLEVMTILMLSFNFVMPTFCTQEPSALFGFSFVYGVQHQCSITLWISM